MPLTIHHLRLSQSERVIWLCEELSIPYDLKCYDRNPTTSLAPDAYRALHPVGTAPVIEDGPVVLAESGAIFEYILAKYGEGRRLVLPPSHPNYPDYVFWLHHANGSIMPTLMAVMAGGASAEEAGKEGSGAAGGVGGKLAEVMRDRLRRSLLAMEKQLGRYRFLAGDEFTAADCMVLFPLATMRLWVPFGLEEYPALVEYLGRVGTREACRVATEKGDPGLVRPLGAVVTGGRGL
ncbi:putative glutathione S-transferase [Aspergillus heteromorphus CBS 117.55]|uniref:glutathione transferase n=1 Tax=Aspergillus heteromorphus CBS 117.55 TaxID=1448321 RepID=A0A317WU93_9EURO|nr:putative glutathione S-transferase [Aspergillus heteromorphus CBS 117.55]PWY89984.1 putative glutathione S-transferase [Aspergillus heteromorphus CBS 117.55]